MDIIKKLIEFAHQHNFNDIKIEDLPRQNRYERKLILVTKKCIECWYKRNYTTYKDLYSNY